MSRAVPLESLRPAPAGGLALFGWVRLAAWRSGARALLHAPAKAVVVVSTWSVLLAGLYVLSHRGMRFLYDTAGLGPFLMSRLWFLFLFVVSIMLAVSQCASAYSTAVRAPETRWWMVLPVPARVLGRVKWIESSWYSAWAVAFLALPVALAYLVVLQRPLWLAGWVIGALLVPLAGIMTGLASLLLLLWLRWCGRVAIRRELVLLGFVMACGALFWLLGERHGQQREDVWFLALQDLLPRMQIAMSGWLPSSWAATALDAGLNGRWRESGLYTLLLWTTLGLVWRALDHGSAALLLPVLRAHAQPVAARSRSARTVRFDAPWWAGDPWLASFAKDALLIARDPVQWSQAMVFFGLLGTYFANIHRLAWISVEPSWRIGIASLNLACTLLILGSLAVRFLFPQMSLEGRSLWLVRIAPHGMRRLLLAKLYCYGVLAAAIIEGLLLLSANRLGIPLALRWWFAAVGLVAGLTVVGMTAGLGAWWIDVTAQDAARLVSSSRGALTLVLVLGYIGVVVSALALGWIGWQAPTPWRWVPATVGFVVVSGLAGALPVLGGLARLERLDHAA